MNQLMVGNQKVIYLRVKSGKAIWISQGFSLLNLILFKNMYMDRKLLVFWAVAKYLPAETVFIFMHSNSSVFVWIVLVDPPNFFLIYNIQK